MLYDWLKALHIIAVIAWMAGMLYLPRLFVYHAALPAGSTTECRSCSPICRSTNRTESSS